MSTSRKRRAAPPSKKSLSRIIKIDGKRYRTVPLFGGHRAIVNLADYRRVSGIAWHVKFGGNSHTIYAVALINGHTVYMHALILGVRREKEIDHKNHNGLDNRRCNLRHATHSQQHANKKKANGAVPFKGVSFQKHAKLYEAYICPGDKKIPLGYFRAPEDAAHAYDKAARGLWGEFACVNFPRRGERGCL